MDPERSRLRWAEIRQAIGQLKHEEDELVAELQAECDHRKAVEIQAGMDHGVMRACMFCCLVEKQARDGYELLEDSKVLRVFKPGEEMVFDIFRHPTSLKALEAYVGA